MKYIQSTNLIQWADTKSSEGILPLLLRKLIICSCGTFPDIHLPAGDSIYKRGIDGVCTTEEGGLHVPAGTSYWEFGRNDDYKGKFEGDFKKRNNEIAQAEKSNASFIFLTPRRWTKAPRKDTLAKEKQKTSGWKAVHILDADDLETWLERCPQVAVWLAEQLELFSLHTESAEHYWHRLSTWDTLHFSPEFLISGRKRQQSAVVDFIENDQKYLEVQGTSRDETICFIIAACIAASPNAKDLFFARTIIVDDENTLKEMCARHSDMLVIFDSGNDRSIERLNFGKNKVFYPVSFQVVSNGLTIPIPKTEDFVKQLEQLSIDHKRAYQIASECGKSFSVLSRYFSNTLGRVNWTEGNDLTELIPILFVQKFDSDMAGDRQLIENLSGGSFSNYIEKLKKWTLIFDKPVYQVANIWQVVSAHDLLFVLGRRLTEEHFKHFEEAFFEALEEIDPSLRLQPNQRFAAALFNATSVYSNRIKEGLCLSLILFSLFSEQAGVQFTFDLRGKINAMVSKLLQNKEISFWQTIESKLNLLGEAAPVAYLDALEAMIKRSPDIVAELFNDKDFSIFSRTYHAHILWSLESLAWDKTYLGRVTLILGNLVLLDKGTKTANRPINSLKYIFSIWLPQTYVLADTRHHILRTLAKKNPDACFSLLQELVIKQGRDIGMYTHQPLWRLRDQSTLIVDREELLTAITTICSFLIELSGKSAARWTKIIDLIDDFYDNDRKQILQHFKNIDNFDGDLHELRATLQSFISRHKTHANLDWALPKEDRLILEEIYSRLTERAIDKYAWCFNVDYVENRLNQHSSLEQLEAITYKKRAEGVKAIIKEEGISGISALAPHIKKAAALGSVLAHIDNNLGDLIYGYLSSEDKNTRLMAMGYLNCVGELSSFNGILSLFDRHPEKSEREKVLFLIAFNSSPMIWDLVERQGKTFADIYWQTAFKDFNSWVNPPDLERCILSLNQQGRFVSSVNLIGSGRDTITPHLLYATLDGMISNPPEADIWLYHGAYGIAKLFEILDADPSVGNMPLLEWKYFEILQQNEGQRREIKYIYPALSENPEFFAQLVSWIFIPENRPAASEIGDLSREAVANRAKSADKVLEAWDHVPGETPDGKIDFIVLQDWCRKAVEACKALDRAERGYYKIGQLLGQLRDGDTNWPQPEICALMEELDHESSNTGFYIGAFNGRGPKVKLRSVSDGDYEKQKSNYYRSLSEKLSPEYPVTAAVLQRLADSYAAYGKQAATHEAQRELE
jgi:hypothetical protein